MALTSPLDRSFDFSSNARFQQRIQVALLNEVAIVAGEAGATTDHANRIAFASIVLYNPQSWAQKMALGLIVVNANIQTAITNNTSMDAINAAVLDADIEAALVTVWSFFSDAEVALQAATRGPI